MIGAPLSSVLVGISSVDVVVVGVLYITGVCEVLDLVAVAASKDVEAEVMVIVDVFIPGM